MWASSTWGEPNEIKANTHRKNVTGLFPVSKVRKKRAIEVFLFTDMLVYARAVKQRKTGLTKCVDEPCGSEAGGGQMHFVWFPARTHAAPTPPCGCIVRVVSLT